MTRERALATLEAIDREMVLLSHISGVLVWDQEAVPPAGVDERAAQLGLLDRKMHELTASDEMGELLTILGASEHQEEGDPSLDDRSRGIIRWYYRTHDRSRKQIGRAHV